MKTIKPTNPDNYLTQAAEVDIRIRVVSQAIYAPDDDPTEWKEITPEEAEEILRQQREIEPNEESSPVDYEPEPIVLEPEPVINEQ